MNHVDRGKRHVFGEINITPLTDIFLALLSLLSSRRTANCGDIKMPRITTATVSKNRLTVNYERRVLLHRCEVLKLTSST